MCRIWPMIGSFNIMRSITRAKLRDRRSAVVKPKMLPSRTPSIAHQYDTMNSEASTIMRVKAGRSAPKPLNSDSNCGTT